MLAGALAVRADSMEQDVVAGEEEAVGIMDSLLQPGDEFHIHVKDPATFGAPDMAVVMAPVVKAVRPAGDFQSADFSPVGKQRKIPVYGGFADGGVVLGDFRVNLIGRGMAFEPVHCLQNQGTLNRIAALHMNHPQLFSIDIIYQ